MNKNPAMKKNLLLILTIIFALFSCTGTRYIPQNTGASATAFEHVKWSKQSNVYEVNLRQYTKSGTIKEFQKSLPRLKEMGVEILWFMPITPIGLEDRKGDSSELGSYYAVKNYTEVNPEFGTMADWKELVKEAHTQGFKVITDWVANHSSPDNPWVKNHPNFYKKDSTGKIISPFDWTDTRKLDYTDRELRDSMIAAMKFWITETNIDGFRCDVAEEVPTDFWLECITELKKLKDVFMLAEGENPALHYAGFDATYAWTLMGPMADVYSGKKPLSYLDSVINHNMTIFPVNAYRLYFTTNHDENSWNGTEFEKYGDAYRAFAVFVQTMYQSIPLIYSGQEIPNKKRLKFFVKDPIEWTGYKEAPFYETLLHLRKNNSALAASSSYKRLTTSNDAAIFAYLRQDGKKQVLVVLNLSKNPQQITISDPVIYGKATNVFNKATETIGANHPFTLSPWGYAVYDYNGKY